MNVLKIASITPYCNEDFRLENWIRYYQVYKKELYLHIIVNNGNPDDTKKLQKRFPDSVVIYADKRALTYSNNTGIKKALANKEVDAIALIGNDIEIEPGGLTKLGEFLVSQDDFGMVSPVILQKDSEIVECNGMLIHPRDLRFIHLDTGKNIHDLNGKINICDGLPGGICLARRNFYVLIGLQDEYLHMYSDEVDMGIRAAKAGLRMASTAEILTWHQHIYPKGNKARSPLAGFFMGRNDIYLAKKHFKSSIVFFTILHKFTLALRMIVGSWIKNKHKSEKLFAYYLLVGAVAGVLNLSKVPSALKA